jgi:hypothetical protein
MISCLHDSSALGLLSTFLTKLHHQSLIHQAAIAWRVVGLWHFHLHCGLDRVCLRELGALMLHRIL